MISPGNDSKDPTRRIDHEAVPEVFADALELPEEDRAAYLDRACAGSATLRSEVETLLRARAQGAGEFLREPLRMASSEGMVAHLLGGAAEGARIGPYQIVRRLGVGGMGAVYLAERVDEAFQKRVAIKLVHPSLWGSDAILRFRLERQVLADLEHPGIARLLDGGTTTGEQPYFVMEYVDGLPFHAHCKEHRLDVDARLALFLDVCEAVLFAHQNLVIHRDLKPSNILVDRSGRVKLLDFGIAKVLAGAGKPESDDLTRSSLPLTPRYASPEQVRGGRMTTATDIYSLGVVLYELLTDGTPFDLDAKSPTEVARIIAMEEPIRPSRRVDPAAARPLAGDLDVIVLKALQKDPARRYETVKEFAADIRRHVAGLPVLAQPDSAAYQVSKFVARHKKLVASTSATVIVILTALVGTVSAYRQATAARRDAEWHAYIASLAAAEASIRSDQIAEAAGHLEAAPAHLRSWEWQHFRSRVDRSVDTFTGHRKGITQILFRPDGERFLTCSVDSMVKAWKGMPGELIREYGPFPSEVESIAWVAGTELVAVGCNDGHVFVLDQVTGATRELLPAGPSWASVSVSPDGSRVTCGFSDGRVRVWSLPSGALLADWKSQLGFASALYSPDGSVLAIGAGSGAVTLYNAQSHARIADLEGHERRVYRMAFSPDGSKLVTGSMDQTANVWDVGSRSLIRTFREHRATVGAIAFDSDGGSVVTAAADNRVLRWQIDNGALLGEFRGHVTDVSALAGDPRGTRVVSGDWNGIVKSWKWDTEDVRTVRVTTGWMVPEIHDAAWDPEETHLILSQNEGYSFVWNRSGTQVRKHFWPTTTRCVVYSRDGTIVALADAEGKVALFRLAEERPFFARHVHEGIILRMTIDAVGSRMATASADSRVKVFRFPEIEEVAVFTGHRGAVEDVEFSPAGDILASCGEDGTIRLWDPASGRSVGVFGNEDSPIHDVAFDASGQRLVSVSHSGAIQIWDVARMRALASFANPGVRMRAVSWSHDGTRIAAGGSDSLVRLYDVATGRAIASLHGHVGAITSLRFGRDDAFLTSTSIDGTARIWTAGPLL